MLRRHVGLSSLERQTNQAASFDSLSTLISATQIAQLQSQYNAFQSTLRMFASKHRTHILKDAEFRQHFSAMCAQLGVDPLGGGKRALWDFVGLSDWTFTLAIQVVDVCMQAKERNGGLLELGEVLKGVSKLRTGSDAEEHVTESDIVRAIKILEPLGCGYAIVTLSSYDSRKYIRCVPQAFDSDAMVVLECCSLVPLSPYTTYEDFYAFASEQKGWTKQRSDQALHKACAEDGLVWVDGDFQTGKRTFWATSLVDFSDAA